VNDLAPRSADRHSPKGPGSGILNGLLRPLTDGVITIRAPEEDDPARLISGRDEEWQRWLGPGSDDPWPTACIVVAGEVVGWVDFDSDRRWLRSGEVNIGYNVFRPHRGKGYATRALELISRHLERSTSFHMATLLIHPDNVASLAVAAKARFTPSGDVDGSRYFIRPVAGA
jgi:RimJ/RimL family protein N-acetyltransferase